MILELTAQHSNDPIQFARFAKSLREFMNLGGSGLPNGTYVPRPPWSLHQAHTGNSICDFACIAMLLIDAYSSSNPSSVNLSYRQT